jgi:hypothetical protein
VKEFGELFHESSFFYPNAKTSELGEKVLMNVSELVGKTVLETVLQTPK